MRLRCMQKCNISAAAAIQSFGLMLSSVGICKSFAAERDSWIVCFTILPSYCHTLHSCACCQCQLAARFITHTFSLLVFSVLRYVFRTSGVVSLSSARLSILSLYSHARSKYLSLYCFVEVLIRVIQRAVHRLFVKLHLVIRDRSDTHVWKMVRLSVPNSRRW